MLRTTNVSACSRRFFLSATGTTLAFSTISEKTFTAKRRNCCLSIRYIPENELYWIFLRCSCRPTDSCLFCCSRWFLGRCENARWAICDHFGNILRTTTVEQRNRSLQRKQAALKEEERSTSKRPTPLNQPQQPGALLYLIVAFTHHPSDY